MKNLKLEEETIIKDTRSVFKLEKEAKAIKDRILRDTQNHFEHKHEENDYKPVRVASNFRSKDHIEDQSAGDRIKTLSVKYQ